jgi:hypothetical protein
VTSRVLNPTPDDKSLGVICRKRVCSIVFVIIESGITLFAIPLARLVITTNQSGTAVAIDAYALIAPIHEMVNVIILSGIVILFY